MSTQPNVGRCKVFGSYPNSIETTCRLPQGADNRIVFSFGTNDSTWENGPQRVHRLDSLNHCRQILTVAKQHYPILMSSPPPIADSQQNDRTALLCEDFLMACLALNILYLDILPPSASLPPGKPR